MYAMVGKGPTLSMFTQRAHFQHMEEPYHHSSSWVWSPWAGTPIRSASVLPATGDGGQEEPMGAGGSSPGRRLQGFPHSIPTLALCLLKDTSSLFSTYLWMTHLSRIWVSSMDVTVCFTFITKSYFWELYNKSLLQTLIKVPGALFL